MLHAADKSPVKYERVCIRDGHAVAWEDLVKGYEYAKGHFVILTKDDFKAAAVEKTRTIDIIDFVQAEAIDDRFFETPYYLVPAKGGERAYALLREAIRESDRIGIAKFILRDAQHLAAVEAIDEAIVLSVMRFGDELADPKPLGFPSSDGIRKAELDMAKALVNSLAADWDPEKYTDEYVDNLMRIIKGKVKGKKVTFAQPEQPQKGEVVDLMERLRRSLDQAGAKSAGAKPRAAKKTAGRKRKRVA
jgi:DNA end-binding protein Ku